MYSVNHISPTRMCFSQHQVSMNPEHWGPSLKKCMYLLCHNELWRCLLQPRKYLLTVRPTDYVPSIAEMEVSVSGCLERVLVAIKSSSYSKKKKKKKKFRYLHESILASSHTGGLTSGYLEPYICAHVSY